mmetsp:Transcript_2780/g.4866  ORF Transcript_2780/g.4866 Transcript_2780/m.4866 type:complete len:243 (-) Transcript_2780:175-903(-)
MNTTTETILFVSPWYGAPRVPTLLRDSQHNIKPLVPFSCPTRRAKIITLSVTSNTNANSSASSSINTNLNSNTNREPKSTTQLNATSPSTTTASAGTIDDNVQLVHSLLTFVSTRIFPKSTYETIQSIEQFLDPEVSWKNPAFKVNNVNQAASQLKKFTSFFRDARFEYHEITALTPTSTLTSLNEQDTAKNVNVVFCHWTLSGTWPLFWKTLVVTGKSKVHVENGKIKTISDSFKWGGKQV